MLKLPIICWPIWQWLCNKFEISPEFLCFVFLNISIKPWVYKMMVFWVCFVLYPIKFTCPSTLLHAHKWTYNLINVVNNLLQCCAALCQQCCAAPCQQLLLATTVHGCLRSTIIFSIIVDNHQQAFSSTIVSSCPNNIVTTIILCQHRTTIDRTILIEIVNSTSVVKP